MLVLFFLESEFYFYSKAIFLLFTNPCFYSFLYFILNRLNVCARTNKQILFFFCFLQSYVGRQWFEDEFYLVYFVSIPSAPVASHRTQKTKLNRPEFTSIEFLFLAIYNSWYGVSLFSCRVIVAAHSKLEEKKRKGDRSRATMTREMKHNICLCTYRFWFTGCIIFNLWSIFFSSFFCDFFFVWARYTSSAGKMTSKEI